MTTMHLLNMACERDLPLADMMFRSARRFDCVKETLVTLETTDYVSGALPYDTLLLFRDTGFGQWGWPSTRIKFDCIKRCMSFMREGQYLVLVDSDVVFGGDGVFKAVRDKMPPIAGGPHSEPKQTPFGEFRHYSGACIFLRADVVKYLAEFTEEDFKNLEAELRSPYVDCTNEDVAISWAVFRGPFGPGMSLAEYWKAPNIDSMLAGEKLEDGIYHLNVTNKQAIPQWLRDVGHYPPWTT